MIVMNILTYGQAISTLRAQAKVGPLTAEALLAKANEDGSVQTSPDHGSLVIKRTPGGYLVRSA